MDLFGRDGESSPALVFVELAKVRIMIRNRKVRRFHLHWYFSATRAVSPFPWLEVEDEQIGLLWSSL
jgi:hypothetical protein